MIFVSMNHEHPLVHEWSFQSLENMSEFISSFSPPISKGTCLCVLANKLSRGLRLDNISPRRLVRTRLREGHTRARRPRRLRTPTLGGHARQGGVAHSAASGNAFYVAQVVRKDVTTRDRQRKEQGFLPPSRIIEALALQF